MRKAEYSKPHSFLPNRQAMSLMGPTLAGQPVELDVDMV
jgi:hypothetical protein